MNRWAWIFFILLSVGGMGLVIHWGLRPKPVRLVKPSYFDNAQDIGRLIWERYRDRFENEKNIIVGIEVGSKAQELAAKGFLSAARKDGFFNAQAYREARLDTEFWPETAKWNLINVRKDHAQFIETLRAEAGFFLLPNTFVSHVIGGTPVLRAEQALKKKVLSISFVGLVLAMQDLDQIYPRCDGQAAFGAKTSAALGCAAKRKSISLFRKNLNRKRYVMAMEQTGQRDYLVYVWSPGS